MSHSLFVVAIFATLVVAGTAPGAVVMEMVTIGDPGNTPDDETMWVDGTTDYGGVAYTYSMGKYEVSNAQYTEFLNAVAASDPNSLYSQGMDGDSGGINREGFEGTYTYAARAGRADMPVNFVSWYDALRFANWLHNGHPTGAQGPSTTEDGAYDMSLGSNVVRKAGARVVLPSEDEWYKAAYYKGGGNDAGFWDYPTETDEGSAPTLEPPPGTDMVNGSANCDYVVVDLMSDVGAYTAKPSDSAYGTFDQGGNVWEWNEALIGSSRGVRGGAFAHSVSSMHAALRNYRDPMDEDTILGFRVARVYPNIPAVSEWGLLVMALLGLMAGTIMFRQARRRAVPA